jgi:ethanolamine ammonia-lyase small subunit
MVVEKCQKNPQVQILVVDGLSSSAIEANIPDVLPVLTQGLTAAGIKVGTPFFIKYGRVGIQDEVGMLLNADVVISLIGERPGLVTADSMSAYMIYKPNENTVEADRTMISNIHKGGTPPAEAGALLVDVVDH